eukprot:CAMPEP_0202977856 /NCGR_PEP_ID=MMETSP1396-20130829/84493_1 /ASSEMBLY_ACC=CAM_ASM_000872 /TAXON_ID= /ORGANISM="Pseudokeronopsis sp., Strain Brazil" /LENGTH=298 /DNA_ID=CAMNT_0049716673 /DNA_START=624 /DNA_END=1520 /DNA_ORIENTATION=+
MVEPNHVLNKDVKILKLRMLNNAIADKQNLVKSFSHKSSMLPPISSRLKDKAPSYQMNALIMRDEFVRVFKKEKTLQNVQGIRSRICPLVKTNFSEIYIKEEMLKRCYGKKESGDQVKKVRYQMNALIMRDEFVRVFKKEKTLQNVQGIRSRICPLVKTNFSEIYIKEEMLKRCYGKKESGDQVKKVRFLELAISHYDLDGSREEIMSFKKPSSEVSSSHHSMKGNFHEEDHCYDYSDNPYLDSLASEKEEQSTMSEEKILRRKERQNKKRKSRMLSQGSHPDDHSSLISTLKHKKAT